jgi:cysteine synthase A
VIGITLSIIIDMDWVCAMAQRLNVKLLTLKSTRGNYMVESQPHDTYTFSVQFKGRGMIYPSIVDTIGNTPLVKIQRLAAGLGAEICAKLEFFNPLSSVKDRLALAMVEAAEAQGVLKAGSVMVEPTSGNTGIALAFIAAAKGYELILTMPESMSVERRKMLTHLGATLELTPASQGMRGAIQRAEEITQENPRAILMQQFKNPANPAIHRVSTAEEIWYDTAGKVDVLIAGVGTGGTITGTGQVLKRYHPALKVIAVEPAESPVLSGGVPGPHKIQGIGAGFVPDVLDRSVIDEVMAISSQRAFEVARQLACLEGIPAGISSGATMAAALDVAAREELQGKRIVVILASCAERYLSTDLFLAST